MNPKSYRHHINSENFDSIVDAVNEIGNLIDSVNEVIGPQLLILTTHLILIGVSLMFMVAHKISTVEKMFTVDSPTLMYIISALHVQFKILQISFFGHQANMMV